MTCPMCGLGKAYQVDTENNKKQCKGCGCIYYSGETPTEHTN